jgi:hypothetical protein
MVLQATPSAERTNGAFLLLHGHCFQMGKSDRGVTTHCDEPVVWKGTWHDVKGEVWTVEACANHMPAEEIS